MRNLLSVLVCITFMMSPSLPAQNQQWPMVNCEKGRSSWASFETVLYPPLQEVNVYPVKTESANTDALTLYNGLLCISLENDPNVLEAFDLQTGDTLWTFMPPETVAANDHTAAQNDSLVFFGGQWGLGLYALYRESGEIKWFKPCGSLSCRNVILDEDLAYFVCDSLYCIDIADGSTIWSFKFNNKATPAVDDHHVYISGSDRSRAFDKFTGSLIWEQYNGGQSFIPATVDDLHFYTGTNDSVVARSKENGGIQWAFQIPEGELADFSQNALSVSDSFLCFICWENSEGKAMLYALDKFTGAEHWRHTFEGEGVFPSMIANGVVYLVTDYDGALNGFNVRTGQQVFYNNDYWFSDQVIVANHRLYAGADERVVVFESIGTGISESQMKKPASIGLLQNYPNPFNAATEIEFVLQKESRIEMAVFNIQGQAVQSLYRDRQEAGIHRIAWYADPYPAGLYLCRLEIFENGEKGARRIITHKMILQK